MSEHDEVIIEREVHHAPTEERSGSLIGGIIVGILLVVAAIVGYFVLTDDDDDGNIEVPVVDVEAEVEPDPGGE